MERSHTGKKRIPGASGDETLDRSARGVVRTARGLSRRNASAWLPAQLAARPGSCHRNRNTRRADRHPNRAVQNVGREVLLMSTENMAVTSRIPLKVFSTMFNHGLRYGTVFGTLYLLCVPSTNVSLRAYLKSRRRQVSDGRISGPCWRRQMSSYRNEQAHACCSEREQNVS